MRLNDILRTRSTFGRLLTEGRKKVLTLVLTIAALAAGHTGAWAASTFTVTSSGNTFTITRSGNIAVSETVLYRTVSLTAYAGFHFTEPTAR